jgi:hypothetical protein
MCFGEGILCNVLNIVHCRAVDGVCISSSGGIHCVARPRLREMSEHSEEVDVFAQRAVGEWTRSVMSGRPC